MKLTLPLLIALLLAPLAALHAAELLLPAAIEHVRIERSDSDRYQFLHDPAIEFHKGELFAAWYNCPEKEIVGESIIRCRRSKDGGKTWSALEVIAEDTSRDGTYYVPAQMLSHGGVLHAFVGKMKGHDLISTCAVYVLDEATNRWQPRGDIADLFLPNCQPVKMSDGNWIMAGRVANRFGVKPRIPAVAISRGDDLTGRWQVVPLQAEELSTAHCPETTVWVEGRELLAITRNNTGAMPFVFASHDYSHHVSASDEQVKEAWSLPMKSTLTLLTDISRRTFLQRSAGALAASAGLWEYAKAETENTYGVETPELRSRAEVEAVLGKAPKPAAESSLRPLTILFAGGAKDHPPRSHSHDVLPKRWKVLLGGARPGDEAMTNMYRPQAEADRELIAAGSPRVKALSTLEWPTEEHFATADVVVLYQHPKCWSDARHLRQIEAFLNRGGGLVLSHYVLWHASAALADLLGLAKGKDSQYKHKVVTLKLLEPRHPIMHGLPDTFTLAEECFWNLQGDRSKVTALATSDEVVGDKVSAEPVIWAYGRGKGRVAASTLGHFDWTFDDPFFRTILLRGIAWAAGESPYRFDSLILRGIPLKD